MVWTISLPCVVKNVLLGSLSWYLKAAALRPPTWFSTTQLGSICTSPSGSRTTVWYSLKSVSVTSAFSGHTSTVSTMVSLSKSLSHTLPTPSPEKTNRVRPPSKSQQRWAVFGPRAHRWSPPAGGWGSGGSYRGRAAAGPGRRRCRRPRHTRPPFRPCRCPAGSC